jgi:hypothetical protein
LTVAGWQASPFGSASMAMEFRGSRVSSAAAASG